jgi:hypothetical protein
MTISTDTRTQTPSGRIPRRRRSRHLERYGVGLALAAAVGAIALVGQFDDEPRDVSGGSPTSAFARPTAALGGRSLAAYVAGHQSDRLERR